MRAMTRNSSLRATLGLMLTLSLLACAAPLSHVPTSPAGEIPGKSGVENSGQPSQGDPALQGTIKLAIAWPEQSKYQALAIPKRTLAIRIKIMGGGAEITRTTLRRPSPSAQVVSTANLSVSAGPERTIQVAAYDDEYPSDGMTPIAQGEVTTDVEPGVERDVRITLSPATPPIITSFALSGGPESYLDIYGENFDFYNGPQIVKFGGIAASWVDRKSSTHLQVMVPGQGLDGRITVEADGITGTSSANFQIIRELLVFPATNSVTVGTPVEVNFLARDGRGFGIADPVATLTCMFPVEATDSTFVDRVLTPSATGTYEFTALSGSTVGTASVTVVAE